VPLALLLILAGANGRFVSRAMDAPTLRDFVSLGQTEIPDILDQIASEDDIVGCFDSGSISYFSNRPVVNLDGLVNSEVVALLSEDSGEGWIERYARYLSEKRITILVGGTAFYWPNYFPDLTSWETLSPPLKHINPNGEVLFLRVPRDLSATDDQRPQLPGE
jgi:hypothetical protein